MNLKNKIEGLTTGEKILWILAIVGIVMIIYRFVFGLGAVTNLSDGYPWGFWIGFDILAGIALAAGGFVMAGLVHLFGGKKFHPLVRPAILTAFLGYLLFIFSLLIDLGRPWNIWRPLINWNHESAMFEVSWCVMFYTFILLLEFLPAIFERYQLANLTRIWYSAVPWLIMAALTLFAFAMTDSMGWAITMLGILLLWEVLQRLNIMPRDLQIPLLLVMAGFIFSTLHQSSLGTLFPIMTTKLHSLWLSPTLPLMFFISALMVAPAMVIFEAFLTEKLVKHEDHFELLVKLSRVMPFLLAAYLFLKVSDIITRNVVMDLFIVNTQSISWWLEMIVGVIVPFVFFIVPEIFTSRKGLLVSAVLVIVGILWNRMNIAVVGMVVEEWEKYYPLWSEIFITIGIVAIGILVFRWVAKNLPVYTGRLAHPI